MGEDGIKLTAKTCVLPIIFVVVVIILSLLLWIVWTASNRIEHHSVPVEDPSSSARRFTGVVTLAQNSSSDELDELYGNDPLLNNDQNSNNDNNQNSNDDNNQIPNDDDNGGGGGGISPGDFKKALGILLMFLASQEDEPNDDVPPEERYEQESADLEELTEYLGVTLGEWNTRFDSGIEATGFEVHPVALYENIYDPKISPGDFFGQTWAALTQDGMWLPSGDLDYPETLTAEFVSADHPALVASAKRCQEIMSYYDTLPKAGNIGPLSEVVAYSLFDIAWQTSSGKEFHTTCWIGANGAIWDPMLSSVGMIETKPKKKPTINFGSFFATPAYASSLPYECKVGENYSARVKFLWGLLNRGDIFIQIDSPMQSSTGKWQWYYNHTANVMHADVDFIPDAHSIGNYITKDMPEVGIRFQSDGTWIIPITYQVHYTFPGLPISVGGVSGGAGNLPSNTQEVRVDFYRQCQRH